MKLTPKKIAMSAALALVAMLCGLLFSLVLSAPGVDTAFKIVAMVPLVMFLLAASLCIVDKIVED